MGRTQINSLASFFFATWALISAGWLGDLIKEGEGEIAPFAALSLPDIYICHLGVTLLFFIASSWLAYHLGKELLPLRHLSPPHQPTPHRVLIMPLSPLDKLTNEAMPIVLGENTLQDAITKLKDKRWNGDNLLRAIQAHETKLERLYLVLSSTANAEDDSQQHYEELLLKFCPKSKWEWKASLDFEEIPALYSMMSDTIKETIRAGYAHQDIMLDCTGGMKATSIAAALATLHYKKIEVQYVQTNSRKVLAYDMQSMPLRNNA